MQICRTALPLLTAYLFATGCDGDGPSRNPGRSDCDTDITYDARKLATRINVAQYGSASLNTGKEAIREVDESAERFMNRWKTVCKDYKNGALTREEYRDESNRIRGKMEHLEELAMLLENAGSEQEFNEVLRRAHAEVVPAEDRSDVSVELQFMAKRVGEQQFSIAPPGATLATDAEVFLNLNLSASAYVYIYQIDASGAVSALFPHAGMPMQNPLPGGKPLRIPPTNSFTLNDKDLGIEDVHIVASAVPLPTLETGLTQAGSGNTDAKTLQCNARGLEYQPECPASRGLVYAGGPAESGSSSGYSVKAVNAAADDGVHVVYSFHHVGQHEAYGKKKTRGIEMLKTTGGGAPTPPANRDHNFEACPGTAQEKEMPVPGGAWERWCVEVDGAGTLVDTGPYRKWRDTGKAWVVGQFEMGRRTGRWTTYGADGSVAAQVDY